MKKALIIPVVLIGLLAGCHPEENPEQLKAVNQSLEYANGILQDGNNFIYEDLIAKEKDPPTFYAAKIWKPRANQIKLYADSIKVFLKNIKSDLIAQSDSFKKEYVTVAKQLYDANGVGAQLFYKLVIFKDSSLAIIQSDESNVKDHFLKAVPLLSVYSDSSSIKYKKNWLEKSFGRSSSLMAMVMLNKIQSDVLATERILIEYCNSKVVDNSFTYKRFSAIAVLSSNYVKAGQSIEVTAGVGAFSDNANARITINGKEVELGVDATASYKFRATGAPGKHTVPITIHYSKPDGTDASVSVNREYIIAEN